MRTGSASILRIKGQLTLQGEPSGFNSCKGVDEMGSGFNSRKGAMFRKPFYYLIPSLVAIVRGIISLMRFVSYCSCLGFGLASDYTDVVLNTVLDIVGVRI